LADLVVILRQQQVSVAVIGTAFEHLAEQVERRRLVAASEEGARPAVASSGSPGCDRARR
jgi:hypothetical protein